MKRLNNILNQTTSELFESFGDISAEADSGAPVDGPMIYHGRPDDLQRFGKAVLGYFPKTGRMTYDYVRGLFSKPEPEPDPTLMDKARDYYNQTAKWIGDNPLPAAGIGIGVPLAMAGSYYAYKKMKERKDRENAGM